MMNPSISDTMVLITTKFSGVIDNSGERLVNHFMRVAMRVVAENGNEDEIHAALLHDLIEDTDMTLEDLRTAEYSENVIEIVDLLTHSILIMSE